MSENSKNITNLESSPFGGVRGGLYMKQILLSAHCKTDEQKNITKVLLDMLLFKNHRIDVTANFDLDIQKNNVQAISVENLLTKDYDVILAYNLKGYQRIKSLAKTQNIPVVYVVNRENSEQEYLHDFSLISKFLVINDGSDFLHQLLPRECSVDISYPYLLPQQDMSTTVSSDNILVATDDKTLLKIIPVLNNYGKYHFTIVTDIPSVIKKIVNANCTVVSKKRANIVDYIENTSLVVGCGLPILISVSHSKPAIVVGKFGFGRRVTLENIENHFYSMFKGRLGARGEESVPFHLLSYEIDSCMNTKSANNEAIAKSSLDFLSAKREQTADLIDALISSAGNSKSVLDIPLRLSLLYKFIPFSESSYLVVDDRTLKMHAMIEQNEYDLIRSFEKGAVAKNLMQQNLFGKAPKQFVSFVKYLVAHKFLLPYDE